MLPDHLFPFQAELVHKIVAPGHRILGTRPGSGKSVMDIAAWEALGATRILIICPRIMCADWAEKVRQWGQQNYTVGFRPGRGRTVVIRNYEQVNSPSRRAQLLAELSSFDVLILDEGQRLRNLGAAITVSIYGTQASGRGLCTRAGRVWPTSGTIAVNHIGDIFPHVHALAPELLPQVRDIPMNYAQFMNHFAITKYTRWGEQVIDMKHKAELRAIVNAFVLQCDPKIVQAQFPPCLTDMRLLPTNELDLAAYNEMLASEGGVALARAVEMSDIWGLTESLAQARRILGELKAAAVAQYVREILETDPEASVLVFAHHRSVLKAIADDLSDIDRHRGLIDGETGDRTRQACIASLQSGMSRVLVMGIATAREGITLTRANRVVLAEASWVPAENEQAIARAARIGQTRTVLAEYVCIADTLDEALMRVCARKSQQLTDAFKEPS